MAARSANCGCKACRCGRIEQRRGSVHDAPPAARRRLLALAALLAPQARAQSTYPNQTIRFIVPYAAGGLPDTVARIVGQHLQERIGQSVVVENRAGGGAAAAVSALMGAPADGYTFLVTDGGIVSTNPALFKHLTYDTEGHRAAGAARTHADVPGVAIRTLPVVDAARVHRLREGASGRDQLRLVRRRLASIISRWRR